LASSHGGTLELKELDEFLLARALEHDSPLLLCSPVPLLTCRANLDLIAEHYDDLLRLAGSGGEEPADSH
jgi:hypothetical protein